jgi:predicted nuclease of predicted toxin-antitoxin system
LRFLIDESMPRSLAALLVSFGFEADDVRDIGLKGRPDAEILAAAADADAIIVTKDRGFARDMAWPEGFTAGVILVNLPDHNSVSVVNGRLLALLASRLPESLLGAVTFVEPRRALSRVVRRRP